jgi:hypothetical protein
MKKYNDGRDYYYNPYYWCLFGIILFSVTRQQYDTVLNNLKLHRLQLQGMDKVMETDVKDTHNFINTELGHHCL